MGPGRVSWTSFLVVCGLLYIILSAFWVFRQPAALTDQEVLAKVRAADTRAAVASIQEYNAWVEKEVEQRVQKAQRELRLHMQKTKRSLEAISAWHKSPHITEEMCRQRFPSSSSSSSAEEEEKGRTDASPPSGSSEVLTVR